MAWVFSRQNLKVQIFLATEYSPPPAGQGGRQNLAGLMRFLIAYEHKCYNCILMAVQIMVVQWSMEASAVFGNFQRLVAWLMAESQWAGQKSFLVGSCWLNHKVWL